MDVHCPTSGADVPVRLSICIPTYNFGKFIGAALDSMLVQWVPGVEVVVLDSGSTDDTLEIVGRLAQANRCLKYHRVSEKGGIDRDLSRVAEMAAGDYYWFFSADDIMEEGAVLRVLTELENDYDVYLCKHRNSTITMRLIHAEHPVLDSTQDLAYDFRDSRQRLHYFKQAVTTEAFFSFMGSLIVKRTAWASVRLNEAFVGSCWAHVARMFELMSSGFTLKYLSAALLNRRGDNDSFADQGMVRRYAIAIEGYHRLAEYFWGAESEEAFHIRRVIRNEFKLRSFLTAKSCCTKNPFREDVDLLDSLVAKTYSDRSWRALGVRLIYRIFPMAFYQPLRRLQGQCKQLLRLRRPL
jgi:abequosyltransferase